MEEGLGANWLRLRNDINTEVGVFILVDSLRLCDNFVRERVEVADEETIGMSASLLINGVIEGLKAISVDLDGSATGRGTRDRRVISHNRVLVVLEGAPRVLLVDDTLTRELLVVVADLYSKVARVINLLILDHELA